MARVWRVQPAWAPGQLTRPRLRQIRPRSPRPRFSRGRAVNPARWKLPRPHSCWPLWHSRSPTLLISIKAGWTRFARRWTVVPTKSMPRGSPLACWRRRKLTPRRLRARARARSRPPPRHSRQPRNSGRTRAEGILMDQQTCRATFGRLIKEETSALGELAALLEREFTYLKDSEVAALSDAMRERHQCVLRILKVDDERRELCRTLGRPFDLKGIQ